MTHSIDLNADLGESFAAWTMGNDEAMLDIVTSANIACGFHAGDPTVMDRTVRTCLNKGVGIGAHPGFDDLTGFGRRRIHGIEPHTMKAMLVYQIGALSGIAAANGTRVRHVKVHGALGNMASEDLAIARVYADAVGAVDPDLIVVAMAATALEEAVLEADLTIAREIYADRTYNDDGTLTSRARPDALIHDAEYAADRVLRMLDDGAVISVNDVRVPVSAQTICLHGDNPAAVTMAETIRARLEAAGVRVESMKPKTNGGQ
ncbi:MAG: 5-oxoprolinase subunit PxpA [Pseudomonadota bacterium]